MWREFHIEKRVIPSVVEGSLYPPRCPQVGMLRLRMNFASRNSFSAQHDIKDYANCRKNLTSFWKNNCKSSTPYFNSAIRSGPMPKAKPDTFLESYPLSLTNSNT